MNLYAREAAFLTLALLVNGSPAFADCVPEPSKLDSAFGLIELGTPSASLPADTWTMENCIGIDNVERTCAFLRNGVWYSDIGRGVEGKSLYVHAWNADPLPFGLSKFDKIKDVVKKMAPYSKVAFTQEEDYELGAILLRSGFCYVNSL